MQPNRRTKSELPIASLRRTQGMYGILAACSPDQTVGVYYRGPAPKTGERIYWTVTVWDKDGNESSPSKPAFFEMGLLPFQQFSQAHWISHPGVDCPYYRKDFSVHGGVKRARLYATARGLYRIGIDGKPVGKGATHPGLDRL